MIDESTVRGAALALPCVEERPHFGRPSFRVRDRIFLTIHEDHSVVLKLSEAHQAALAQSSPDTFAAVVWGNLRGWTRVDLATVDPEEMRELVSEGWCTVAPRSLVAAHDAETRSPGT